MINIEVEHDLSKRGFLKSLAIGTVTGAVIGGSVALFNFGIRKAEEKWKEHKDKKNKKQG